MVQFGIDKLQSYISDNSENIIVLADKHTYQYCYPLIGRDLPYILVPYGEGYKNLQSCEFIWKKLTERGASRNTIVLCLGGGVLCDMGAFAGSVYQRGMKIVLCPTSLLAMVDASVGGKNGVNFMGYKNYIGNFREADEIFICNSFLNTLPQKEWINGYVEMLKHGVIADKSHYENVRLNFLNGFERPDDELIRDSVNIKLRHVEQDFRDESVRKRLNFGHTIGHAIESWSLSISKENKELSHGVSVALGMVAESYLSTQVLKMSEDELNEITTVIHPIIRTIDHPVPRYSDIASFLIKDKKNTGAGVNFSLLRSIGDCVEDQIVEPEHIQRAMEYLNQSF